MEAKATNGFTAMITTSFAIFGLSLESASTRLLLWQRIAWKAAYCAHMRCLDCKFPSIGCSGSSTCHRCLLNTLFRWLRWEPYHLEQLGSDLGVPQRLWYSDGTKPEDVTWIVQKARNYVQRVVPFRYNLGLTRLCKNLHEMCSIWALRGECETNSQCKCFPIGRRSSKCT